MGIGRRSPHTATPAEAPATRDFSNVPVCHCCLQTGHLSLNQVGCKGRPVIRAVQYMRDPNQLTFCRCDCREFQLLVSRPLYRFFSTSISSTTVLSTSGRGWWTVAIAAKSTQEEKPSGDVAEWKENLSSTCTTAEAWSRRAKKEE